MHERVLAKKKNTVYITLHVKTSTTEELGKHAHVNERDER
jgi:hypothetical protein